MLFVPILITVLTGYLLGNLNGAVSMSSLLAHDDVRGHGSGNAGLTNFARNYGAAGSVLVVLIDLGKTVLASVVGRLLLQPYGYDLEGATLGAVAVSLGHDFPALLGFKGGKGIICGLATAIAIDYRCALIIFGLFAVCFLLTGYVSLGSIVGAAGLSTYFAVVYWNRPWVMVGGVLLGLLAIFMHRGNIVRLCKGTERRVNLWKKKEK